MALDGRLVPRRLVARVRGVRGSGIPTFRRFDSPEARRMHAKEEEIGFRFYNNPGLSRRFSDCAHCRAVLYALLSAGSNPSFVRAYALDVETRPSC